jgi:hypothetical protein
MGQQIIPERECIVQTHTNWQIILPFGNIVRPDTISYQAPMEIQCALGR